ncbi:cytochrome P450 [Cylindrobasidium torrendii FP15055 ss-10]|uniref:Cytochrome P450 n=1 Tax=Cylindrobasidium torrendii FP15055 ss-10 TaxID=1314674 RepID=A0A0D7B3Y6_9AGAR|nr:cytochrome P450 [Cylindrobasidium torrendii FP15055 ss-10]
MVSPFITIPLVFAILYMLKARFTPKKAPFPPGPKPLPVLGNIFDVPAGKPWKSFATLSKQYGDLVYMGALGVNVLVVNSVKAAEDLFDKHSRVYSDRPNIPMVSLMGWDINIILLPYGELWRKHRRIFHQEYRAEAMPEFREDQEYAAMNLLRNLAETPKRFKTHLRLYPASITMHKAYGHWVTSDDPIVDVTEQAGNMLKLCIFPGSVLVNVFPFLRHLPEWFPGTGFKAYARKCRGFVDQMRTVPYDLVKQRMAEGTAEPCLTTQLLEENEAAGHEKYPEELIKDVTATAFAAAVDTSAATLDSLILALVKNPEVQRKAQAEIDTVVGDARLPNFEDRKSMPYVEAIYRELIRWAPAAPMGVPHAASEDNLYNGFLIPKGTIVLPNIWAMSHDENKYSEPDNFMPERFFREDGTLSDDTSSISYGFGRRVCVGRYVAETTAWLAIASLMAVYTIKPSRDAAGNEIPISGEFRNGAISMPLPFECDFVPRSPAALSLISAL